MTAESRSGEAEESVATPQTASCAESSTPAEQTHLMRLRRPGLQRLYVSTATEDWSNEQRQAQPAARLI